MLNCELCDAAVYGASDSEAFSPQVSVGSHETTESKLKCQSVLSRSSRISLWSKSGRNEIFPASSLRRRNSGLQIRFRLPSVAAHIASIIGFVD